MLGLIRLYFSHVRTSFDRQFSLQALFLISVGYTLVCPSVPFPWTGSSSPPTYGINSYLVRLLILFVIAGALMLWNMSEDDSMGDAKVEVLTSSRCMLHYVRSSLQCSMC